MFPLDSERGEERLGGCSDLASIRVRVNFYWLFPPVKRFRFVRVSNGCPEFTTA